MQLTLDVCSDATLLRVAGSFDAVTVADFEAEWKKAVDSGTTKLVVDLSGVDYISSAGLRGVLLLAKTSKARGFGLAFAGLTGMVADMFKLSGFLTILAVYPDADTAAAAL